MWLGWGVRFLQPDPWRWLNFHWFLHRSLFGGSCPATELCLDPCENEPNPKCDPNQTVSITRSSGPWAFDFQYISKYIMWIGCRSFPSPWLLHDQSSRPLTLHWCQSPKILQQSPTSCHKPTTQLSIEASSSLVSPLEFKKAYNFPLCECCI